MKTITFFSEKGGVGKSTFSIMYASWLHCKYGVKAAVLDYNNRIARYRESEIEARKKFIKENPDTNVQPLTEEGAWPVYTCRLKEINNLKNKGEKTPYLTWTEEKIKTEQLGNYDVVLYDFPGSLSDGSFQQLLFGEKINLVVIPTERDAMTLESTLRLYEIFGNAQNYCCFVNKAQISLKNFRKTYIRFAEKLKKIGLPILPDMVSYSERIMNIEKVDIIRSTFSFPDFTKPEFGGMSDLGLENLFIDITRELYKTKNLAGTTMADLSFVENLRKSKSDKSFTGSSYPEYEID